MEQPLNSNTLAGTAGGTLLVLCMKISLQEVFYTALLAAIGAAVSFGVSMVLRLIIRHLTRKK